MTSAVKSSDYYYAQSFTPTRNALTQISLYLQKVGSPTGNLEGGIYADDGSSKPNPLVKIAGFGFAPESVSTTAAWVQTPCEGNPVPGVKYWVVLHKNGDAGNHYLWYHDGLASGSHCYSSDNVTWTITGSSYNLTFKTHYDVRLIITKEDASKVPSYEWRETIIREDSIVDSITANAYAAALLVRFTDETAELSDITILNPTAVPSENTYVAGVFAAIDASGNYDVEEVSLGWNGGEVGTKHMTLAIGRHVDALPEFLAGLKKNVDQYSSSDIASEALLDTLSSLSVTNTMTSVDSVSTVMKTLTYYIQEEYVDLDDWTPDAGDWAVTDGNLFQTNAASGTWFSERWTGAALPTNFIAETKIRFNSHSGYEAFYAGMICRSKSTTLMSGAYYYIRIDSYHNYLDIFKWNGTVGTYLSRTAVPIALDVQYKLRVYQRDVAANWQCTVWLDDYQVVDYTETPRSISDTGYFWLSTCNLFTAPMTSTEFDYCRVWTEA
jgi:hypothetical protein